MSTSPQRTAVAPHEDLLDIEALQRTIERREELRRVSDAQYNAEKRDAERRAATLELVISDADDQLAHRSHAVSSITKDSAATSAELTRQLTARHAAIQKLNSDNQQEDRKVAELHARCEEVEAQGASLRMQLAQTQVTADERQQQSAAVSRQLHDQNSKQQAAVSSQEAQRSLYVPERRKLEHRTADLQQQLAKINEESREVQTAFPAAETMRNDRRTQLRRQIDSQRERNADDSSVIRSLRALLAELVDGQEEAARRRRRAQEEETKDRVATRRQAAQAQASALADLERRIRSKTESMVSEAQTTVTHLALESLPQLREECRGLFDRELELRDEAAAVQRETVGIDAITERISVASDQLDRLSAAVDDLADQCEVASATLSERERRADAFRDAVAPLDDVESNCLALATRQRELSKKLSDDGADHAVWNVKADEEQRRMDAEIVGLEGEVKVLGEKKVAEQNSNDEESSHMESLLRQLEGENKSLSERIQDTTERNEALDATIEHIARQRRAHAEEMAERRNAARAAAASLLSQLE